MSTTNPNEGIEPEVVLANYVTMACSEWQMIDPGREAAVCEMLVPLIAQHLGPILAAARAEGFAQARTQAQRVLSERAITYRSGSLSRAVVESCASIVSTMQPEEKP